MASDPEVVADELAEHRQIKSTDTSVSSEVYAKYDGSHNMDVFRTAGDHGWVLDSIHTTSGHAHLYFIPAEQSSLNPSVQF